MATSLIMKKRITTTLAKAKELRKYVEPLITKGKSDTTHNRRTVFSYLQDKEAIKELFNEIGEKVAERNGGYTRIIKLGTRLGDNADVAIIELVDYNEAMLNAAADESTGGKTRRRRRGGKKSVNAEATADAASTEEVVEATAEETPEVEASKGETAANDENSEAEGTDEEKKEA